MNAAALAPAGPTPCPAGPSVMLLDHDTDWGRAVRSCLMSWGIEVRLGPQGGDGEPPSLILMASTAPASARLRHRLGLARRQLPEARLCILAPRLPDPVPPLPAADGPDEVLERLATSGIGFLSEGGV